MPEQENNVVVEETVQATQSTEQSNETVEDTTTETTDTGEQAKPSLLDEFEYQYNKESQKPQSIEELKELAEMGRYYKEQGKEEINFIKAQAKKYNMTTSEYRNAVAEQEKSSAIQEIAETENVSEDVAERLYKASVIEKENEQRSTENRTKAERDKHFDEWVTHPEYKSIDKIPDEVMSEFEKGGKSLVEIYRIYDQDNKIKSLTEKLSKYEAQEQTENKNSENAVASTGSVTGNGTTDNLYTKEQVKNMSREDVLKNYKKIQESQKNWQ